MKKSVLLAILVVLSASLFSCGGGGSSASVTVTLSPVNGATYKLLGTAVTATFSSAITAPADWSTIFTLKKNNTGDNLCTSVTLSADTLTATCVHDELDFASSYTIAVTGLSGVTDPTSATFQTSNLFAGFAASNGNIFRLLMDYPTAGKISIWSPSDWEGVREVSYVIDPADPTLYTLVELSSPARISGSFVMFMAGANNVVFGMLIDPNQTNMNFRAGTNYGGQSLEPDDGIIYYTDNTDTSGTATILFNSNISNPPGDPISYALSGYVFDAVNYDLVTTIGTVEIASFINADGYGISRIKDSGTYIDLFVGNEDRVNGNIPSGVAVGDVYKGYIYEINTPPEIRTIQLTVTAMSSTSVSFETVVSGVTLGTMVMDNVTDPATWGTGFYKYIDPGFTSVIRFLNSNTIQSTGSDPLHSSYNFGLLVK